MSDDEKDLISKGRVTFRGIPKDPNFVKELFKDADKHNKKQNRKFAIFFWIWFSILMILAIVIFATHKDIETREGVTVTPDNSYVTEQQ